MITYKKGFMPRACTNCGKRFLRIKGSRQVICTKCFQKKHNKAMELYNSYRTLKINCPYLIEPGNYCDNKANKNIPKNDCRCFTRKDKPICNKNYCPLLESLKRRAKKVRTI